MRGYVGIGIEDAKFVENLGTLWRSAFCLGADYIFTVGDRYRKEPSDTVNAWKQIPYFHYKDLTDLQEHLPKDAKVVGVEVLEGVSSLETFAHPKQAVYLLGGEDRTLTQQAQGLCDYLVKFDSKYCLNVAVAGSIVLYDRKLKSL